MTKILKEGNKAPSFSLPSSDGTKLQLKDLKGQKVVLFFYPKDLTPGCTVEACDFRDASQDFKKKKTAVFGISKDNLKKHDKFIEKHELNFPLLSDEDGVICEKYGVMKEKSMFGKKYMGIERTTFIIDEEGKIEKIYPKVRVKGHVEQVLDQI